LPFSYAYTRPRVATNPINLFSENSSLARVNSNQLDISYHSWTIGYHSYSLSLRGETEVFHFFFLSRGYAGELCKACLSKSKFCLSFQLANKINSNLTCTIKQSNPMNTVLQDNTPRVIYIRKWQARLEYVLSTCTFALKLGRPFL
jgi:hypothetical protein